ncbi:MAG: anhydro-N-acetylmuramic acid kinase, partial [Thermomicrobium sp.]
MSSPRGVTKRSEKICVGLLSGTSADAIDAAVVSITGAAETAQLKLLAFVTLPIPAEIRRELFLLFDQAAGTLSPQANTGSPGGCLQRLCTLHVIFGELFAEAAHLACQAAGVPMERVFVIGSHGQTVWHQPIPDPSLPLRAAGTLQIGNPAVIALRTGVPVISSFRDADLAVGGQGAPLVPYFDWVTLRDPHRSRAVQNIGGIGNVTYLPANCTLADVLAFDTGPGTMVIDGLVQLLTANHATFDQDGLLAAQGRVDHTLLAQLLNDDFLNRPPPKTTGRERYGLPFVRQLLTQAGLSEGVLSDIEALGSPGERQVAWGEMGSPGERQVACGERVLPAKRQQAYDLLATATAFTAYSIALAYQRWLPRSGLDEVIVSGGGARNPTLLRFLQDLLAPIPVRVSDTLGIDAKAKEAMAFALLAHDAYLGLPTNVPRATGARQAVTLGS